MSVEAMLGVQKLAAPTTHACFRALMTLAEHADKLGANSWPSVDTIAAEAQMDEKTVRRSLAKLEQDGLIAGEKRRGRGGVTIWRLLFAIPSLEKKEGTAPGFQEKEGTTPALMEPIPGTTPAFEDDKPGILSVKPGTTPPEPVLNLSSKEESSLRSLCETRQDRGDFEAWWQAYPRKVGKDDARKAYAKALKRPVTPAALLDALTRQRWNENPQYRPYPATWLNDGRWQDDPTAAAPVEANLPRAGPVQPRRPATNGAVELLLRARERRAAEPTQPALEGVAYAVR